MDCPITPSHDGNAALMLAAYVVSGVAHGFEHVLAGLVTGFAGVRANAAVVMHCSVPAAFFGASAARLPARRHLRLRGLRDFMPEAQQHGARGVADIRAVEIKPDALRETPDGLLRQARVGAGEAGLHAGKASLRATLDRREFGRRLRVRAQHGRDVRHSDLRANGMRD